MFALSACVDNINHHREDVLILLAALNKTSDQRYFSDNFKDSSQKDCTHHEKLLQRWTVF